MNVQGAVVQVLAQVPPAPEPGGQGEDFGKSSPVGLVLLILFAIAVALLVRSMTKHLKRLPTSFDEQRAAAAAPARVQRAEAARAETDSKPADSAAKPDAPDGDGSEPGSSAGSRD